MKRLHQDLYVAVHADGLAADGAPEGAAKIERHIRDVVLGDKAAERHRAQSALGLLILPDPVRFRLCLQDSSDPRTVDQSG